MTTNELTQKIYVVREMSLSDDPSDQGEEVKRFRGEDGWEKAKDFRDSLYRDDGIKSYISIKELV